MSDEKAIPNYPGNSQKKARVAPTAETPRKLERVTTTAPIKAKKPLGKRIAETFTGDDMHSVGSYLLFEVMIPAAKSMIVEAVEQGIQRMLFGDSRPRSSSGRGYTPYNRVGSSSRNTSLREPRQMSRAGMASHNFDEIIIESRPEAEMVLETLLDAAETYETATVADLYSLVGMTPSFVDNQWGWERADISTNAIRRVPQGYLLDLPKPIHLK